MTGGTKATPILVAGRVMLAMRLLDFFRMGFRWGFGGGSLGAFTFTHLRRPRTTTTAYIGIIVPVHPRLLAVGSGQWLRCRKRGTKTKTQHDQRD